MTYHRRPDLSAEDQLRIINECRRSGLSDAEYCRQHDIPTSTFYSWVHRLRTHGGAAVLDPSYGRKTVPAVQDVVAVDVIPKTPLPISSAPSEVYPDNSHAIEVSMNDITIRIQNHADPQVLAQTLKLLKELTC